MFRTILKSCSACLIRIRLFSASIYRFEKYCCKVLVVGGGTGGCALSSKLSRIMKKTELIVLEPSENHFYQGWFTLCGAGIKKIKDTVRPMATIIPSNAIWLQTAAIEFCPENNVVVTCEGDKIEYDILVITTGIVGYWDKIPGAMDALKNYDNVGTIYLPQYAEKTYHALKKFKSGNMIFTYPCGPTKCSGAPLKICYLIEDILRSRGIRDRAKIYYHTPSSIIYTLKYYERTLLDIAVKRDINIELLSNLVEVRPERNEAVLEDMETHVRYTQKYALLHVVPPMWPPEPVKTCDALVNKKGFVEVNQYTLQHVRYCNIFSLGDCNSVPTAKTASACVTQAPIVFANIKSVLAGKDCKASYDGYTSCPIVTAIGKCVLAEYDYNRIAKETFPFSQNRELWITYFTKEEIIPRIYWNLMVKGYWNGPYLFRRILHFGFSS